jgi:hypothetical protein
MFYNYKKVVDRIKNRCYNKVTKLIEKTKTKREANKMKKLNKYDFKVIDEFECNITKRVGIYEDENKNIHVIDEFDCDITKTVRATRINK